MNRCIVAALAGVALLLSACGDKGSGPVEVKWDRDTCDRCGMVLSDREHAAQVRGGPAGQRARVYKFDDIGGAIAWLDEQPWKDAPGTEFWVTDHRDGHWIDGRKAVYLAGHMTAMDFGYGAQDEPAPGGLGFAQVSVAILEREAARRSGSVAPVQHAGEQ